MDNPPSDAIYRDANASIEMRVANLISRMTLEEKVGQLHQESYCLAGQVPDAAEKQLADARCGAVGSLIWGVEDPAARNLFQRAAVEESRLGIPLIFGFDAIHGFRTIFPISLGMACAWEPQLFRQIQSISAREARACGIDWAFSPMSDIARDPRWGRVAETCGEDPFLTSLCVAEQVRGFQGESAADDQHVVACLKHFVGYGAVVGGRDYNHAEIPESILRSTHLPPFKAGVDAGAMTVMSSFNTIDGIPAVANRHTLTDILRGDWGFDGFVVSDWGAVSEMLEWGFAADNAQASRLAISAGNDMDMISGAYRSTLPAAVRQGEIAGSIIDQAVSRVLRIKFATGLFEHPYVDESAYAKIALAPDAIALARQCAARSAVLLKNNGILPITPAIKSIALIGPFADDAGEMLGCWSGQGHESDVVTLAAGLKAALGGATKLSVVKGCEIITQARTRTLTDGTVVEVESAPKMADDLDSAVAAARDADVVIMTLGEPRAWTGENASRAHLSITGQQQQLFDAVAGTGKPIVVVLFCGRPLVLGNLAEKAAAILIAWQPGVQAGNGLTDVLLGAAEPSGRLAISIPRDGGQVPLYYNRYHTGRPTPGMTDYRDLTRDAQFWFGYGLTYTTFNYGLVRIATAFAAASAAAVGGAAEKVDGAGAMMRSDAGAAVAITTITNTGTRNGTEVVQLYVRQLANSDSVQPEQELRAFQRVTLSPGQTKEVRFRLDDSVLGHVGRDGQWRVTAGRYQIWISPHAQSGRGIEYETP